MDGQPKTLSLLPFYKPASTYHKIFFFIFILSKAEVPNLTNSQELRVQKELPYFHELFFNYNWLKLLEKQPKMEAKINTLKVFTFASFPNHYLNAFVVNASLKQSIVQS